MKNNESKLISRIFFRMVPIQILLVVIGGINTVIDSAFASNLIGPAALAVTGLFLPAIKMLDTINSLMFGGSQLLCGKYIGAKSVDRSKSIFTLDMLSILSISMVFIAACEICPGAVADVLGANKDLRTDLIIYIRAIAPGILPLLVSSQLTAFLQLEHQQKRGYVGIVSMFLSNALFNWLFVGVLDWGIFGLGMATTVSDWIFFLVLASYYVVGKPTIAFSMKNVIKSDLGDIFRSGIPYAIGNLCQVFRAFALNSLLLKYAGSDGLSAYSTVMSFGCIYWALPAGITSAVMLLASVYSGEQDKTSMNTLMKVFLKKGVGLVCLISLLFSVSAWPITNIFYQDPSLTVFKMTFLGFTLFPLSSPLSAVTIGFNYLYHTLKHEKVVNINMVADGIAAITLLAFILMPIFGINGLWAAQILNGVVTVSVLLIFVIWYNHRFPRSFDDLLCLPEGFDISDDRRMDVSIKSMDDVINISEKVKGFCVDLNVSERYAYFTSLCVEEMAGNIVKHGFNDGKKHNLDLRISVLDDEVRISFKDDCKLFNPKEAQEIMDPEDITHNIGLRIIGKISKSMSYQSTLGLNVLSIVI